MNIILKRFAEAYFKGRFGSAKVTVGGPTHIELITRDMVEEIIKSKNRYDAFNERIDFIFDDSIDSFRAELKEEIERYFNQLNSEGLIDKSKAEIDEIVEDSVYEIITISYPEEEVREKVLDHIIEMEMEKNFGFKKTSENTFEYEIYANYDDYYSDKEIESILTSKNPIEVFDDKLYEGCIAYMDEIRGNLRADIRLTFETIFKDGFSDEEDEKIDDYLLNNIVFKMPEDHYLKQEICVNIMMDTGDGNYDYTLNNHYPAWSGPKGAIDPKASIAWLAKTQGYTAGQLRKALNEGDLLCNGGEGFLASMRQEVANISSHMSTVIFLVKMTLEDAIKLNRLVKLQDRNGHFYDATKNPDCGYIILDKKTETGLYDPWAGGGSVLEVQLEKDVKIPVKFIRSALPDGCDGYSVAEVYGVNSSLWKATLTGIKWPNNLNQLM